MRLKGVLLLLSLFFLFRLPSAEAQSFQGKTITLVVGYKPGGGYDRYARLIAKYMPKYVPGNPSVIVQNMPGANSIIAANYLFSIAKPDGLTFGSFNNGLVIAQLIKVEGMKFDLNKFNWLGSAATDAAVVAIRTDLPYKTVDDMRKAKQPIVIGSTGPGASTHDFPLLLKEFAGLNFNIIPGYSSSADIMLAIERKENDGRGGSYASLLPFIERNLVRPMIRTRLAVPGIEHLPSDEQLTTDPKGKAIMAVRSSPESIYRPYVAPPGTPPAELKILRNAFASALKDEGLLAEAKKGKLPIDYLSGEDALKTVKEVLDQPPELVKEIAKYLKFGD